MYFNKTTRLLLDEQDGKKLLVINGAWWAKKLSETLAVTDFDEDNFQFPIIKLSEQEEKMIKGKDYNKAINLLLQKSKLDNEAEKKQ